MIAIYLRVVDRRKLEEAQVQDCFAQKGASPGGNLWLDRSRALMHLLMRGLQEFCHHANQGAQS